MVKGIGCRLIYRKFVVGQFIARLDLEDGTRRTTIFYR